MPPPFLSHCDDPTFSGTLMNEGPISDLLGVAGTPNLAACHFPLSEDEVRLRLPAALTSANGSKDGRGAETIVDQPSSSSST